ncbi:hypothetical protein CCMSSC00406_0008035 [Pleurotus cornucopiae]|uniref:Uncharacterized protein n=1 Tax=Pleurotus cornucopiae TaxID=5321 RepID=A0ACB7IV99_PLECO|nr:hypothetical protein CCMSSC00406_0008035 [Pleurotus cornucopiae]
MLLPTIAFRLAHCLDERRPYAKLDSSPPPYAECDPILPPYAEVKPHLGRNGRKFPITIATLRELLEKLSCKRQRQRDPIAVIVARVDGVREVVYEEAKVIEPLAGIQFNHDPEVYGYPADLEWEDLVRISSF